MTSLDTSFSFESYERREKWKLIYDQTSETLNRSYRSSNYSMSSETSNEKSMVLQEATVETEPLKQLAVPEPSRARLVVTMAACLFVHMASFGIIIALGVLYVELIGYFNSPRSVAALVQSVYTGCCLGGGIIFSSLVTKYNPGIVIILSSTCAAITFCSSSFAPNIETVIVLIGVLTGLACSINILGAFVVVSWVFHRNRKFALGILTMGSTIGQILLPYIATGLIDAYSWTGALLILGALMYLNTIPCGLIIYFSSRYFYKGDAEKVKQSRIFDIGCFKDAAFMIFLNTCFLFNAAGPVEQWFVVDMGVVKGFTTDMGAVLLSLNGIFGFIGRVFGSLILKLRPYTKPELHLAYGFFTWGISHIIVSQSSVYWGMVLGMVLRGLSAGIIVAFLPGIQIDLRGIENYPQTTSICNLLNGSGSIAGGSLGGLSFDITRSYDLIFSIAAGVNVYNTITMLIIYLILKYRRNKHGYESL